MAPYHLVAFALSDVGLIRENNEDVWLSMPEIGLFILADGMGGHLAGEVASSQTVSLLAQKMKEKISELSREVPFETFKELLLKEIQSVNKKIFKMAHSKEEWWGMGTTLCCLLFHPEGVIYSHVGDSRIYHLREGKLSPLTQDHSLIKKYVDRIDLGDDRKISHCQYKNIITKAMGTEHSVQPTLGSLDLREGDSFLMSTDGLTDLLYQEEMECILNRAENGEIAVQRLVNAALGRGGHDNVTVLLVKVGK